MDETMRKKDLVEEVAKVLPTKKEAQAAVEAVFDSIRDALSKGESVTVVGFGTFKPELRRERKARKITTGEEIIIEARNVPKFVPGKNLKEEVAGS